MSKNAFPNAIELIDALFDFVVTTSANDFWRIDIGQVSEDLAHSIHKISGLNLLDYTISIDSSGVRHILNQHGIAENEVTRGQLSVQKKDLQFIFHILETPDLMTHTGKSRLGNPCILVEKAIKDKYYFTLWEIRTVQSLQKLRKKKHRLILHTFYIRKITEKPPR
jgi:phage-Barnase-EndoU-ColicinE5/D-RelE like nuclease3